MVTNVFVAILHANKSLVDPPHTHTHTLDLCSIFMHILVLTNSLFGKCNYLFSMLFLYKLVSSERKGSNDLSLIFYQRQFLLKQTQKSAISLEIKRHSKLTAIQRRTWSEDIFSVFFN